jgi:hypothetical protein
VKSMPIMLWVPDGLTRLITLPQAYWYVHAYFRVPRGQSVFSSERRTAG